MPTEKEFLAKKALLDTKQDKLVAGTNIQIDPVTNRISAINDAEIIDVQVNGQSVLGVDKIARVNVDTVEPNPTSTPTDTLTSVDINGTIYELQGGGGDANYEELTQAEYDALTPEEKMNGTIYFITDAQGGGSGSSVIPNPEGEATDTLNTIGIDNVIYEIQGSGGGGSIYNGALDWSGMITVATSLDQTGVDFTPEKDGVIVASGYSESTFIPICIQITGVSKEIYLTVSQNAYTSEYFPLNKGVQIHIYRGTTSVSLTDIDIYFVPFKIGYNSGDTICEVLFNTSTSTDRWVNPVVVPCIPLNYDLITFEVNDGNDPDNLLMFTPQSVTLDTAEGDYTKGYKLQNGANAYLDRIENAVRMFTSTGTTLTLKKVVGYRFGKGEYYSPIIYSTEEREVGVWIDGKPLYKKTCYAQNVTSSASVVDASFLEINYQLVGYETNRIKMGGVYNGAIFVPSSISTSAALRVYVNSNGLQCNIEGLGSGLYADDVYFTILYTKTTDTPGSGSWASNGVPAHHYSTDEQVVGTWIDGSTVYEKTIDLGNNKNFNNGWQSIIPHNNNYNLVFKGMLINETGISYQLDMACNDSTYLEGYFTHNTEGRFLTFQYTKSTT